MEGTKVLRLKWTALLLSVLIFGGCATVTSIRPGQGTVFEVTGQSYDDVWENAVRVVSWNFEIIESDKVRGIMDESLMGFEKVLINGGQKGTMLMMAPEDIAKALQCNVLNIAQT